MKLKERYGESIFRSVSETSDLALQIEKNVTLHLNK